MSTVYAQEYDVNSPTYGTIHVTTLQSGWCGNLAVSTKVGKLLSPNHCSYVKETKAYGFSNCHPLYLNGYRLEKNAGKEFNCAATHVHSNVTGHDGLDEYILIKDNNGHYLQTTPSEGYINLHD